ncbi:hypothetical protein PoB_001835200 [Plakobranchus ocellatus]|uniref:Uncharacterized protein n=1 Tax=Plakobranchus ocellatus TaxID=259542 RepID=A0AAV3Z9D9_9GAST|nr:hypothetical protein PoB_001835200 [Plakobranchus ocellatus]
MHTLLNLIHRWSSSVELVASSRVSPEAHRNPQMSKSSVPTQPGSRSNVHHLKRAMCGPSYDGISESVLPCSLEGAEEIPRTGNVVLFCFCTNVAVFSCTTCGTPAGSCVTDF